MFFAVDDSEIAIEKKPHTILAGLSFERPDEVKGRIREIKGRFGLGLNDEIKWNGMRLESRQQREALSEELLGLLSRSRFSVTVSEGLERQAALEHLAIQLDDYMEESAKYLHAPAEIHLCCDDGIICDPSAYSAFLARTGRLRLGQSSFESVSSSFNELVQCADMCVGFARLLIDLAIGRPNRRFTFVEKFDDSSKHEVDMDLRHLVLFSLRYAMWGEVPPPPDPQNVQFDGTYPFLHTAGKGLRIHSSISEELKSRIYHDAGVVYFGCLH